MISKHKVINISRNLFNIAIEKPELLSAISISILIKSKIRNSVITDYSILKISKIINKSRTYTNKYMKILFDYGLVEFHGKKKKHVIFNKIKERYNNVDISNINFCDLKHIEYGLRALYIVEKQKQIDYLSTIFEHSKGIFVGEGLYPKNMVRRIKRANAILRNRGLHRFVDNGISYTYFQNIFKCSRKTVSNIISYGEKMQFFTRQKRFNAYSSTGDIGIGLQYAPNFTGYCKNGIVYEVLANQYKIPKKIIKSKDLLNSIFKKKRISYKLKKKQNICAA